MSLSREFVEGRISSLIDIPSDDWNLLPEVNYYQLDLRRLELNFLSFSFYWGDNSKPIYEVSSLIEKPGRLVKIDVSLNFLENIDYDVLKPFAQLRVLDASYNRLSRCDSLQHCHQLRILCLSHNSITSLSFLSSLKFLLELDIGNNELETLRTMPCLSQLTLLKVNNNKLKGLDGIESLRNLQYLYAERNFLTDLHPVASCFKLAKLNAANNSISSIQACVEYFSRLTGLHSVTLYGNPLANSHYYLTAFLSTRIKNLDNYPLGSQSEFQSQYEDHVQRVKALKEAARNKFVEISTEQRRRTSQLLEYLSSKLRSVEEEQQDFEKNLAVEEQNCVRFIDGLSYEELVDYDCHYIRDTIERALLINRKPSVKQLLQKPKATDHKERKQIKDTDEVLRMVYHELSKTVTHER